MDFSSIVPILIIIFAVIAQISKRAASAYQRPRNPFPPSSTRTNSLETLLQRWLSSERPIPSIDRIARKSNFSLSEASLIDNSPETEGTEGIEGTAGVEGTAGIEGTAGVEGSETETQQTAEAPSPPLYSDLAERNLADAVIWAEILGKPKARANKAWLRNNWPNG